MRVGDDSPPDGGDRILDFEGAGAAGGDVIDLSRLAAAWPVLPVDAPPVDVRRPLLFIGEAAFPVGGASDSVRYERDAAAGVTRVLADFGADGAADLEVTLVGLHALAAQDFVFDFVFVPG